MNRVVTKAIVLSRTDYQEADRIITVLTPDNGKLSLMVRGARKAKSKLAGGIELFSISDITYIPGKSEVGTLLSSRLKQHFPSVVKDINRTMFGYDLLKKINKVTEDAAGQEYFDLLAHALEGLDDDSVPLNVLDLWFSMRLLNTTGHLPNLRTTAEGTILQSDESYVFDYESMAFKASERGSFKANQIKLLGLAARAAKASLLCKINGVNDLLDGSLGLAKTILDRSVRI